MSSYHTVLVRDNRQSPWEIHFGDYDRATAMREAVDEGYDRQLPSSCIKVITTADSQVAIDEAVAKLNMEFTQ